MEEHQRVEPHQDDSSLLRHILDGCGWFWVIPPFSNAENGLIVINHPCYLSVSYNDIYPPLTLLRSSSIQPHILALYTKS